MANPAPTAWFSNWGLGATASWELDFWGRYRRAIEAADASLDASIEDYDDVLVILLSDVASSYIEYRTFEERLGYARANVQRQSATYEIFEQRFREGRTAEVNMLQARQILEQTRSIVPLLETRKRQASNRLCVLLGMPPSDLESLLGETGQLPTPPQEVAVGVPADLLRQRPDLRRAERQIATQSALIGVAVSDLYPHITLVGTIGVESQHVSALFDSPGSMIGAIGPGIRWDILNYGRLVNNVNVQDARFQELAYAYQDLVLNAGREVEDGIIAFLNAQEQARILAASAGDAERVVEITTDAIIEGEREFVRLYLSQENLTQQQDLLAQVRGDIAQSLIRVYRALGGGWQIRLANEGQRSPQSVPPVDAASVPAVDPPLADAPPEPEAEEG